MYLNLMLILQKYLLKIVLMLIPFIDFIFKRVLTIFIEKLFHLSYTFSLHKMFFSQILQLFFKLIFSTVNYFILFTYGFIQMMVQIECVVLYFFEGVLIRGNLEFRLCLEYWLFGWLLLHFLFIFLFVRLLFFIFTTIIILLK